MVRVAVVDDHDVVRKGLAAVLGDCEDFEVVAMAADAAEAVAAARQHQPDVLVLDLRLPDRPGTQVVPEIREASPHTRILVLTSYGQDRSVVAAVAAGVDGFLTKTADAKALVDAIRLLAQGRTLLGGQVGDALVRFLRVGDAAPDRGTDIRDALTQREWDVARAVAEGLSNREVAERLFLSEKTVKNHVSDVLNKLHLSRRAQIVALLQGGGVMREPWDGEG